MFETTQTHSQAITALILAHLALSLLEKEQLGGIYQLYFHTKKRYGSALTRFPAFPGEPVGP